MLHFHVHVLRPRACRELASSDVPSVSKWTIGRISDLSQWPLVFVILQSVSKTLLDRYLPGSERCADFSKIGTRSRMIGNYSSLRVYLLNSIYNPIYNT